MRIIGKYLAAAAFFAGFAATLASCHDHDEVCSDGNGNIEQLANTDLTAEALRNVLYNTTALDTLPSNWMSSSFTVDPTCGDCMDQSTPRVRTIVASSAASAIELFKLMTDQEGDTYSKTWSHDSIGTITLNTDSTETLYATIDVNVRQLNLDQIRFVPESALGNNWTFKKWTPRYHFGDVLKVTKKNGGDNQTPEYWLCIRGEFCDPNISDKKETAHWVCFTLDDQKNVEHCVGDITIDAPKNLYGKHTYLQNLPKLLYLISNPTGAFEKWNGIVTGGNSPYGKYCFFGDPFPYNYFYNTDFNRISNKVIAGMNKEGGLAKLIPALSANDGNDLLNHIAAGKPLTFICNGVTYPSGKRKYNPTTFKNLLTYSGNFYTENSEHDRECNFVYENKTLVSFDIRQMVANPYNYAAENFPGLYSWFTTGKAVAPGKDKDTRLLVVRYKSADKFAGIKNPKNHGEVYRSSQLDFEHIVADTYEDDHAAHGYQVSVSDPYLIGDEVKSSTYTGGKKALCIGYIPDKENITNNEIFLCDGQFGEALNDYKAYPPTEEEAEGALVNVLNAYLLANGVSLQKVYSHYGGYYEWSIYESALKQMREKSKTLGDDNGKECMLDKYFKATKSEEKIDGKECTVYSVEINYSRDNYRYPSYSMKLSYNASALGWDNYRYKLTTKRAVIEKLPDFTLFCYGNKVPRAYFQRFSYFGETIGDRNNLSKICGNIFWAVKSSWQTAEQK